MFSDAEQTEIRLRSGGTDPRSLQALVEDCGFDAAAYLRDNADLSAAGLSLQSGMKHYLVHGMAEGRHIVCGPLGDGFPALAAQPWPDRRYAGQLAESLFFAQLRHPHTPARLWQGAARGLLDAVATLGGVAFFVIGDSHTQHYCRPVRDGARWLAPLPLTCLAAAASDLAAATTDQAHGENLLRVLSNVAASRPRWDIPILLKFGGIDAEFRWMLRRVRKAATTPTDAEFDENAARSLAAYGRFLDRLCAIVPAGLVNLCSVFPTVLPDSLWAPCFCAVHGAGPVGEAELAASLSRMELPDLKTRNRLRGRFNIGLRALAEARGMAFVDDFTPTLGPSGALDARLAPRDPSEFHIDWQASGPPLTTLLRQILGLPASAGPGAGDGHRDDGR